jgi:Mitochondrial ribosomal protein L27
MITYIQSLIRNCTTKQSVFPQSSCSWRIEKSVPTLINDMSQIRWMSKYLSKSAKKNLTLTTKRAKKGFYKGKGSTKEGSINSKGRFIVDPLRRLELIIPDLEGFKVCCC